VRAGRSYPEIGRELGIPPGRAYLIATGAPADSSDATGIEREGALPSHAQRLINPREVSITRRPDIQAWVRHRAHEAGAS
jgi:hypothetical protein